MARLDHLGLKFEIGGLGFGARGRLRFSCVEIAARGMPGVGGCGGSGL